MDTMRKIITLTGPSAVGKTTIARALLALEPAAKLVRSQTTRDARPSDLPGEYSYNHQADDFESRKDEYLWVIKAHGNTYATAREDVMKSLLLNPISLMILVSEAVVKLRAYASPYVIPFFMVPPSEEVLRKRLIERGDASEAIERRLKDSKKWWGEFLNFNIPYSKIDNDGRPEETAKLILELSKILVLENA